jgi:hypothetical protein
MVSGQDIGDSLNNGDSIDAIIIDFSKAFDWPAAYENCKLGGGF